MTRTRLREYTESLVVAVLIALILRFFVVAAYKIPTPSMVPTLLVGDIVFASKLPFGIKMPISGRSLTATSKPERGDVVVFVHPEEKVPFVKRVVGTEGDKIEIRNHRLIVNEIPAVYEAADNETTVKLLSPGMVHTFEVVRETWNGKTHLVVFRKSLESSSYGPVIVPSSMIFVLGDNRDSSNDSRYWGMAPQDSIEGRVFMTWLSMDFENKLSGFPTFRPGRFLKSVQ